MKFYEVVEQVLELLQREGRVSYRALQREFELDDAYLEDLKTELIEAKRLAVDEEGKILVWTGGTASAPAGEMTTSRPSRPTTPSATNRASTPT